MSKSLASHFVMFQFRNCVKDTGASEAARQDISRVPVYELTTGEFSWKRNCAAGVDEKRKKK